MPEGDTIYRSATRMREALAGKTITRFDSTNTRVRRLMPQRLVGQVVRDVRPRGKHILHHFEPSGMVLHTHMRMTGTWRVYRDGARWTQPAHLARVVIAVEGAEAVAFAVPVVELLSATQLAEHRVLNALGPDPLAPVPFDLADALRRLDQRAEDPIGVAILNQRVMAGVGNVYANEVLFIHRLNPWTPVAAVSPEDREALLTTAATLLRANVAHGRSDRITRRVAPEVARRSGRVREEDMLWVYGHGDRPCRRCGTTIQVDHLGDHARITYWCPKCQPAPR